LGVPTGNRHYGRQQVDYAVRLAPTGQGFLALLLGASIALANPAQAQEADTAGASISLRIAAGPISEPAFQSAGIVANIVSNPPGGPACRSDAACGPAGVVGEARATPSVVASLESVASGESETAFVEGDALWQAYGGYGQFAGRPLGDLRALGVLYTKSVFMIVRAGAKIESPTDLRRKTVALGALDDPHLHTIDMILTQHGVRRRELTFDHLSTESAAAALGHGDVDAAIVVAASLPEAFRLVAEHTPLRLLPVDAKAARTLLEQQPYLIDVEIGDLAEGRRRTPGLALPVLWVASQRLPAQLGYELVRTLQAPANREAVAEGLPRSSAVANRADLTRSPIPLHIGAARWAEEASGVVR
jgi:TRAP transporter TAXI family solute receptor